MGNNSLYNENYYKSYCGEVGYDDPSWVKIFEDKADYIVKEIKPKTVLDVGCAMGHLVTALRDRGVEAYGIDVSEYAISKVREDIKPYCKVFSALDGLPEDFPKKFDLVTTIEVIEHLREEDCEQFIKNLCSYTDQIIFSSSPDDISDRTHFNVQQIEYWAKRFAMNGFLRDINYSCQYISKQAVCFKRTDKALYSIIEDYERYVRQETSVKNTSEANFTGKVYFNFGDGESEEYSESYTFSNGIPFHQKLTISAGCKSIRLDPIEGYGCLIRNLNVRSDSEWLKVSHCNGFSLNELMMFKTIDPQIYFADLPEDAHWIEIEADVLIFNSAAWLELYDLIVEEHTFGESKSSELKMKTEENIKLTIENENIAERLEQILEEKNKKIEELEQQSAARWKEIQDYSNLVEYERGEAEKVANTLREVLSGSSWKITAPLRFAKRTVKKILMIPVKILRLMKKVKMILCQYGIKVTLKKVRNKLTGKQDAIAVIPTTTSVFAPNRIARSTITGNPVDPIQTVVVNEPVKRLNLVTDTIDSGSLLGGVATALIVATEFANRYGYELRIITRNTETNPLNYENIIKISGIERAKKVSFYSDYDRFVKSVDFKMEISPDDIFFATSWWSAMAIAKTTIRKRFFYIIQEVETFFYNYGGERMLCDQVMQNPNIDFIINSGYLNKYFETHDPQIVKNGCYFEPAFPAKLYSKKVFNKNEKYKLFFYSRPNNPRNLYTIGVEMLKKAVEKGIIDTNKWEIYCVGQNSPVITFENGAKSKNLGQLSWTEYAEFLADVDLGLCLMYTPHPSYPPFDVASSGGVVLSNKMLNKTSFDMCKNVILADLDEESFMKSFEEAVDLAKNMEQRKKNYEENTIPRDWHQTLEETISYMKGKCEDV